ncbi:phosphoribosylglycinamide formyltransferase [Actinomyces vulturis]|uniref:phosphoribosylglycinamide formyltransferase n=1 Tax=Actinomyces vulturis TaxID=1857645 RepID=UPI001FDFA743|nr:phosphoribosylglycinamide formyltransferase [Actinomyces vulturis]
MKRPRVNGWTSRTSSSSNSSGLASPHTASPNSQSWIPHAWPWAVRVGVESVIGPVAIVGALTIVTYLAALPHDAAAALGISSAMSTGIGLWMLGWGGGIGSAGSAHGLLALPMLTVTALHTWWTWHRMGTLKNCGVLMSVWVALSASVTASIVCLWAPVPARTWPVPITIAMMTAVVALVRGSFPLRETLTLWGHSHQWLSRGAYLARQILFLLTATSVIVLVAGIINGVHRILRITDSLAVSGFSWIGLLALHLAWLPTMVIWAASWLIGPGFSVGLGSVFSPGKVVAGAVPALPIFGILPDGPVGPPTWLNWIIPVLLSAMSLAVVVKERQMLRGLSMRSLMASTATATVLVSLGVTVASLLASGPIGPGRMAMVGPRTAYVGLLVLLEVAAGLIAGAFLTHPMTHHFLKSVLAWLAHLVGMGSADLDGKNMVSPQSGSTHRGTVHHSVPASVDSQNDAVSPRSTHSSPSSFLPNKDIDVLTEPSTVASSSVDSAISHERRKDHDGPTRLFVLVSGTGSNLAALLDACDDPEYGAIIVGVGADKDCPALDHAESRGVECFVAELGDFNSRAEWNGALADAVEKYTPDLIVCAGFMKILGQAFLERFEGKIINTHPSLLPKFPGAHAVRDALAAGATVTGASLFWVDAGVDTGAIIAQIEVPVEDGDTEESLTARVKAAETPQLIEQVGILARSL